MQFTSSRLADGALNLNFVNTSRASSRLADGALNLNFVNTSRATRLVIRWAAVKDGNIIDIEALKNTYRQGGCRAHAAPGGQMTQNASKLHSLRVRSELPLLTPLVQFTSSRLSYGALNLNFVNTSRAIL